MRRRYYEIQSKARACPSLVKDRGVNLMNGHGAGGVDGPRVQFRLQCGTWEPVVSMLMLDTKWRNPLGVVSRCEALGRISP